MSAKIVALDIESQRLEERVKVYFNVAVASYDLESTVLQFLIAEFNQRG